MLISWDYRLVAMSVLVAILGSFLALACLERLRLETSFKRYYWQAVGVMLFGSSIGAVYYMGLLAVRLDVPVMYDLGFIGLTVLLAWLGALIVFLLMGRRKMATGLILISVLGLGIALSIMHYTRMLSIRVQGNPTQGPWLFGASVFLAAMGVLATGLLLKQGEKGAHRAVILQRLAAPVFLAGVIASINYLGLWATRYPLKTGTGAIVEAQSFLAINSSQLGDLLLGMVGFLVLALLGLAVSEVMVRQNAVAALRKSEARYKSLIANEAIGILVASLQGPVVEVNDAYLKMIGYSHEDVARGDLRWDTITPAEYREQDLLKIQELAQNGYATEYEKQYFHKDGHRVDVWIGGISRIEGTLDLVVCCLLDITEQKRTQNALLESETRLLRVTEGSNDGFWELDAQIEQLYCSDRIFDILGVEPMGTAVSLEFFKQFMLEKDWDQVREQLNQSAQSGEHFCLEVRLRHASGQYIDCVSRGKPYYNAQGDFLCMAGILSDVTQQKKMENSLRASESKFRQIADSNLLGIAFWNIYGKIYEANDTFLRTLGYSRTQMEAGELNWQAVTLPEDHRAHAERVQKAIRGENVLPYELKLLPKAGPVLEALVGYAMLEGSKDQGFVFMLDITEKKQAENALRDSERRYRFLAEAMPQSLWTANAAGEVDFINIHLQEYAGANWADQLGWGWRETIYPDDRAKNLDIWNQSVAQKVPYEVEQRIRRHDGVYRWHLTRAVPFVGENEAIQMWLGTNTDIDDLKNIQSALTESEARFRNMADSSPMHVWLMEASGEITYYNKTSLEFIGKTQEEILKKQGSDWIYPDDRDKVEQVTQRGLSQQEPFDMEIRIRRHDDQFRWLYVACSPRWDGEGRFNGFVGSAIDIHDRKLMEQALKDREERYALLYNATNDAIWDWNILLDEVDWNDQFYNMFHYQAEQVEHTLQWWTEHIHPNDRDLVLSSLEKVLASGGERWSQEYRYMCGDGSEPRLILDRAYIIHDEQGKPVRALGSMLDITEKRRYERKIQTMAESMPQKIWIADAEGRIDYVNQRWVDYTGILREEAIDQDLSYLVHPDEREVSRQKWLQSLEFKQAFQMQIRIRRLDGVFKWHLMEVIPLKDSGDQVFQLIGSLTDIEEMKLVQSALMESEARFRSLADSVPVLIWLSDLDGKNVYNNRTCMEFLGVNQEALLSLEWLDYVHPDDRPMALSQLLAAQEARVPYQVQYRIRRHDGEYRWLQAIGIPRMTPEGEALGYVGSAFDITEQKQMNEILEVRIQERTRQLESSNIMLHSVVENVPAMIFLKEAKDLRFALFNKAGKELIGFTDAELIGKNDYDFFPEEQAAFFIAKDRETLEARKMVDIPEEPLKTMAGEIRYLHTKKVPIWDESGNPLYLLGISEDITEAKQAQEQIRNLNVQLEEQIRNLNAVNKELEAFSYSVSHDLRAPLRTIDGFSQAVLEDYAERMDEDGRRYLHRIREGSQQMAQLIDDMLNLSRLTRGELKKETVNLSEMVCRITDDLTLHEPERQVTFIVQDNLVADVDKRLIQAVLENLIGNAWKFTSHHAQARIEFGANEQEGGTVYFVRDDGAGFDMAYANKLFGTFQRLHSTAEFKGTGVGLASVQRIIHRHGGEIWAESSVERGATFFFTL